jgi:hypothetical protein
VTKAIAITKKGHETIFMLGDYQATFTSRSHSGNPWFAQYFKSGKELFASNSKSHPDFPTSMAGEDIAIEIVKAVLRALHSGTQVTKATLPSEPKKSSKRQSSPRNKAPRIVNAFQVVDRLLTLVDDTSTLLVPMGTDLKSSKVRIVDSEGETLCEIPYPIFKGLF